MHTPHIGVNIYFILKLTHTSLTIKVFYVHIPIIYSQTLILLLVETGDPIHFLYPWVFRLPNKPVTQFDNM